MRILQLHADSIEYEPVEREIPTAEACPPGPTRFEDLVVLFTAVEAGDTEEVVRRAVDGVQDALAQLDAQRILIYPYAHLSSDLAAPATALQRIRLMERVARERGIEAARTPFGWCKRFTIAVKGHPLAEQLRVFTASTPGDEDEVVSTALQAEARLQSEWYVMDPDGQLHPVASYDFADQENLHTFARYERAKLRAVHQEPPHVTLMKRLELVDNEPGSDPGNLRYYPKGRLVKSLLERFVTQKVVEYGGMEVETPVMYDFDHPAIASYLHRFPARQYTIESDDRAFFLRFSACFGQFLIARDAQISYRQLPFRIYELTRYSFRRELSGELAGLRRLRAFTMPDVHAMCADLDQAFQEFTVRFQLAMDVLREGLGLGVEEYELAIRFTRAFFEAHRAFIVSLVQRYGRPVLIEIWPERFFYFILKWEFNFVDRLDKASALSTDQIDVENAERYNITYVDEDGAARHPIILHCSPSGAIERCLFALLEKAAADHQRGGVPSLPVWLAPTQVRVIPIADPFVAASTTLAATLDANRIRADVDDRPGTVGRKIRDAEQEWIPYIICVGEKEAGSDHLPVRVRRTRTITAMTRQRLVDQVSAETAGKPFARLSLPRLLSRRPRFYG